MIEKTEWLENNPNPSLEGLELPYAVHGMDLAFSGIMSAANRLVREGKPFEAVCWSLQEHALLHVSKWQKEPLHILVNQRFCWAEELLAIKECGYVHNYV